jgi:hypothetical protein
MNQQNIIDTEKGKEIKIINREAGDKFKGARLQKLRVVELMLDSIEKSEKAHIYGAIEFEEDVSLSEATSVSTKTFLEQDKNFSTDLNFTLNSPAILNTLIGFLDIWISKNLSNKNVFLGFYSTRNIGKEIETAFIKMNNLDLPDKPILSLLKDKEFKYNNYFKSVITIIINE